MGLLDHVVGKLLLLLLLLHLLFRHELLDLGLLRRLLSFLSHLHEINITIVYGKLFTWVVIGVLVVFLLFLLVKSLHHWLVLLLLNLWLLLGNWVWDCFQRFSRLHLL